MTPTIKVREIERRVQMVQTRMPFRYGAAKLERCPHLYLVATIEDAQGRIARGIAADSLPPKWFDKDPHKEFAQEVRDQLQVIEWASQAALAAPPATPFRLWRDVFQATHERAQAAHLPGLLASFGPSLVERAVNDAVGHLLNLPFHALLHSNALGIELGLLDHTLSDVEPPKVLPAQPLHFVAARHTVGLSDPIRTADITPAERLNDGLPQSLEEVIAFYGVNYFKIKVQNQLETDLERLSTIAAVLDAALPQQKYFCTLDGNEQYASFEELQPLIAQLRARPALQRLAASILFIEQPLARHAALDAERCGAMESITKYFPVIIDESDDALDSYARAIQLGYNGTSHKNCKNTFKSVLNLARSQQAQARSGQKYFLSAEDLANIGVVALQQDLTALSALGIAHVERNGHHYFRGLTHLSHDDQQRALAAHRGLYVEGDGYVRLNIEAGQLDCRTLHQTPGLGAGAWPKIENFPRADDLAINA